MLGAIDDAHSTATDVTQNEILFFYGSAYERLLILRWTASTFRLAFVLIATVGDETTLAFRHRQASNFSQLRRALQQCRNRLCKWVLRTFAGTISSAKDPPGHSAVASFGQNCLAAACATRLVGYAAV